MDSQQVQSAAAALMEIGRLFYDRNWVLGTSGNFSAVLSEDPFRLLITASGTHKGRLNPQDFVVIDKQGTVREGTGRPSAETRVHVTIASLPGVGAILHTHSVWATILSDVNAERPGIELHGYEMLKGLSGVSTHEHWEWLPVLANTQDYEALAAEVARTLEANPEAHGILLRRHGLYTWGRDLSEAERHVEILEFLLEATGRVLGETRAKRPRDQARLPKD
jgi:methylthioribulose-1-phosphate dehydratase